MVVVGGEGCMQYMSLTFTLLLRDVHILSEKKSKVQKILCTILFFI